MPDEKPDNGAAKLDLGAAVPLLVLFMGSAGATVGLKLNCGVVDGGFVAPLPRAPLKDDDDALVELGAELVCLFENPKLNFNADVPLEAVGAGVDAGAGCAVVFCGAAIVLPNGFGVSLATGFANENGAGASWVWGVDCAAGGASLASNEPPPEIGTV